MRVERPRRARPIPLWPFNEVFLWRLLVDDLEMPANSAAENALGTIGTICWTVQLIPQIWKSWRTKSTEGLSHWLVLLWGIAGAFLGTYVIVQDLNIPLILQPQLFGVLSFVCWAQCLYYGKKYSFLVSVAWFFFLVIAVGGFEAGMVFAIRPSYHRGEQRPIQFFGIFSSVIISLALFPQYYEIYKHREVIGISILFMAVDLLGGVFSDLSLAFKANFDVIAAVTYSLVVVLDGVVIVLALILNPRARRRRKAAAAVAALASTSPSVLETESTIRVTESSTPVLDTEHGDAEKATEGFRHREIKTLSGSGFDIESRRD
ncbi:Uncharacterized protein C2E12.03c [Grifola frondosa]|uniref:Uncharacterized protein C2E12.03c n=1 Tax=Grifola frondosa TaxID=5627 RepID=A0A1C7MBH6_GRIFR|nr:Uncharacterized protein C2E12.03c [Grifola frondosa]